jgi:exoribonuclease R
LKNPEHPRNKCSDDAFAFAQASCYDIVNIGHFGLASDAYLHFTSPIRRYPDVEVHRAVKSLLRGKKPDQSPGAIEQLQLAQQAGDANFYEMSVIDGRLREMKKRQLEEMKERRN